MRVDNWAGKLEAVFKEHRGQPFTWGTHDCITFASDCFKAITGDDPLAGIRGTYTDEATALEVLDGHGGIENAVEIAMTARDIKKVDRKWAQRGDIVIIEFPQVAPELTPIVAAGVWAGEFAFVPLPGRGLERVPKAFVKTFWGVR